MRHALHTIRTATSSPNTYMRPFPGPSLEVRGVRTVVATVAAHVATLVVGWVGASPTRAADVALAWASFDACGLPPALAPAPSVGGLMLNGTLGQWEAGVGTGGDLTLTGGFWAGADACGGYRRADCNCDGAVTFKDIDPFVKALGGPVAYHAAYPLCDWACTADINRDGYVDFVDIDPFVAVLGTVE